MIPLAIFLVVGQSLVSDKKVTAREGVVALGTTEGLEATVDAFMTLEMLEACKQALAMLTPEPLLLLPRRSSLVGARA